MSDIPNQQSPKKLNKLQAILQQQKAEKEEKNEQQEGVIIREEMAEVVDIKQKKKKKEKLKYRRVTLYLSYEDDGWTKSIAKKMRRRAKIKVTKSLLHSLGLRQLQKMEDDELENLIIEEAKNRAVDLI